MTADGYTVLGASGFIGTRLVARLAQRGCSPLIAIDILPPRARHAGVTYVQADVRAPLDHGLGVKGGALINLAAVHRTPGHPAHEYYDTNIQGALNACALAEAAGMRRMVFTSSISVYGPSEATITEQSELTPISDYGRSKRLAEQIHRRWVYGAVDRQLVIVRPAVVFGPGERGNYTRLARALKRGYFVYPGRSSTVKSGGYVDELLNTLNFAEVAGDHVVTYNFAFPIMSSTADIVASFSRLSGKKYAPPTIPLGPVLLGSQLAHRLTGTSTFHPERVLKLVRSTRVQPAWLESRGYQFQYDLDSALAAWSAESGGDFS